MAAHPARPRLQVRAGEWRGHDPQRPADQHPFGPPAAARRIIFLPIEDDGEAKRSDAYGAGQGWTFISGPRSNGGGTWSIVLTCVDRAQSKARLLRGQNSLSVGARCAVRLANSVTTMSRLKRLREPSCCMLRPLAASSVWNLPMKARYWSS